MYFLMMTCQTEVFTARLGGIEPQLVNTRDYIMNSEYSIFHIIQGKEYNAYDTLC